MDPAIQSSGAEALMMEGKRPTPIVRDAHALLVRGIEELERNHLDEAMGLLKQAVQLDEKSFHAQLALGVAATKALEIPQAEQALENAIAIEPRNFWAHMRMAEFFHRVGVVTKCQEELQIALDVAETSEERKIAREMLDADQRSNPRRAWRPDFIGLLSKRKKG
jgi:Tfp pilus assembly protein PilF